MMMGAINDFGKSVPSSFANSASLPIISLPSSTILGQFGLTVAANGSVLLEATVGLENSGANPSDLIFTIVRNAVQIYTIRSSSLTIDGSQAVHISFADSNLPAGYYGYALTVSAISPVNPPVIIGPLLFSGLSIVL